MEKRRAKPHIGIAKFEKRKHPRFLLNLPIEYDRINSDLDPDLTPAGYTFNASEGGLMVNLPEQMDIGQYLRMKLFFSFGPDINVIEMLSEVMWAEGLGEDGSYRSGVRFVEISSENMGKLKNFLKDLSN